jgi:hypothetical protein
MNVTEHEVLMWFRERKLCFIVPGLTQTPMQFILGELSQEVKRSDREAHHSPQTSAEVKKTQSYASNPPYALTT